MDLLFIADACEGLGPIVSIVKTIFNIIKIVAPISFIITGAFDLTKAVMSGDDKLMKETWSKLLKRGIALIAIFFVVFLVEFVMGLIADTDPDSKGWAACWTQS